MKPHFINLVGEPAKDPYDLVEARYVDAKRQRLSIPLRFYSEVLGRVVEVPAGHVSDGRSIPSWLFPAYVLYGGRNSPAAWIHDRLYFTGEVSRELADKVFLEALYCEGERPTASWVMYAGVRVGGHWSYKGAKTPQHVPAPDLYESMKGE